MNVLKRKIQILPTLLLATSLAACIAVPSAFADHDRDRDRNTQWNRYDDYRSDFRDNSYRRDRDRDWHYAERERESRKHGDKRARERRKHEQELARDYRKRQQKIAKQKRKQQAQWRHSFDAGYGRSYNRNYRDSRSDRHYDNDRIHRNTHYDRSVIGYRDRVYRDDNISVILDIIYRL